MEVHEAGGGINYTVEHTKKASEEELYTLLADRLRRMIKSGKLKLNMKIYVQNPSNCKTFYSSELSKQTRESTTKKMKLKISFSEDKWFY